ncbi:hypothetical protein BGZ61DRAFT_487784, partial [Ilyonectria robusta]|uniref:uncharacterized protein n=1 Tax=Ilyonectria robusta TaxID=1079257 RepID=UPI001E8EF11A
VLTNLELEEGFFSRPGNGTVPEDSIPTRDPEYGFAEIGETSSSFVWSGPYTGTFEALDASAEQPFQDVPGLWILNMVMRQAVVELEDGSVIVLDAPPHQSKLVIDWVQQRLGKNVTHVWVCPDAATGIVKLKLTWYTQPTHHHHDHSFGVADYAAVGTKIIVPENGAHYYARLNLTEGQILTYRRGDAMVLKDSKTQLALVDMQGTIHAEDHGYAFISSARPTTNSSTALFEADHANLATIDSADHGMLQELIDVLVRDRVTLDT